MCSEGEEGRCIIKKRAFFDKDNMVILQLN